ncbi:tetratricopeptide repeat protein [Candidatus Uabimicrobium sp. HlEnr_7]|uniref:tetratricopeptide repeat protein n=1 Tax=Candidatus Uabimicrobium helgolandensis TaxID=3095367 RepID=UPI003557B5CC
MIKQKLTSTKQQFLIQQSASVNIENSNHLRKEVIKQFSIVCICFWILLHSTAFACMWDDDTIQDELAVKGNTNVFDLITGQFAHHSKGYYEKKIQIISAKAKLFSNDHNNLAVAYIRLGQYEKGEKFLLDVCNSILLEIKCIDTDYD